VIQALSDATSKACGDRRGGDGQGGMTRMPRVQQLVKEIFGKEGHRGARYRTKWWRSVRQSRERQLLLGSKSEVVLQDVHR
jgi:molecular chaperone DnaK